MKRTATVPPFTPSSGRADLQPRIGVAVILIHGQQVLLGERLGSHGSHTWQFPGGHLEFNESIVGCARRELLEETGLIFQNPRLGPYTNDLFQAEQKHYVTLFVLADYAGGTPQRREPQKCGSWEWFVWGQWPQPHFLPIENLLKQDFNPIP